jgi:hypothetical protein
MKRLTITASFALATVLASAGTSTDQKPLCFWIGGPAMLEYNFASMPLTLAAGAAPVDVSDSGSNSDSSVKIGWAVESFYYPGKSKSGLAVMARGGSADGHSYIGPGVFYVSRPHSGVGFRYGISFPFGSHVDHYVPEIAFGFQF